MRSITLLSTAAVLAGAEAVEAQYVRRWDRPVSGDWESPGNWSPADVPDSVWETAVLANEGRYVVGLRSNVTLRGLEIVNSNASLNIYAGNALYLDHPTTSGSILTINGDILINASGENSPTEFSDCSEVYDGNRLEGTGTIRLNAHPANLNSARISSYCQTRALRISRDCKIAGSGRISRTIDNYGEIAADLKDRVLEVDASIYNPGHIAARNGGIILVSAAVSSWYSTGIEIEDSASAVEFSGGRLWLGCVWNEMGGSCRIVGSNNEWIAVRTRGTHLVDAGGSLTILYELMNEGTLMVGNRGGYAALVAGEEQTTLNGAGRIILDGGELTQIQGSFHESIIVVGEQQSIGGTGVIAAKCFSMGLLSPGWADGEFGNIQMSEGEWRQAPQGVVLIEAAGMQPELHDRITGNGSLIWGGTLKFRLVNGFVPTVGDRFTIATHLSSEGTFADVEFPPTDAGDWRVIYGRTSTALLLTCATDLDNDADTDLSDLAVLLRNFASSDAEPIEGDINTDRRVDVQDLALLLGAFGQRCH